MNTFLFSSATWYPPMNVVFSFLGVMLNNRIHAYFFISNESVVRRCVITQESKLKNGI